MFSLQKTFFWIYIVSFIFLTSCQDDPENIVEEPEQTAGKYGKDEILVKPFAEILGDTAILKVDIVNNPGEQALKYLWESDEANPELVEIHSSTDAVASVIIPDLTGNYYFDLLVISGEDSLRTQTLVVRNEDGLNAFNIDSDSPPWMEKAVIYELTPYNFVASGNYSAINNKLDDLDDLGINTLWIQPVFEVSYEGQGYNVTDYFSLNPALGSELELNQLITKAKSLGMKILFDIPLSQTSIDHPYARDIFSKGENSEYYDYYQHEILGNAYSSIVTQGTNNFLHYFWDDLVLLNYDNEEVQRWMLEACKYWVEKYDIDGYRFDAIWGVNARNLSFGMRLREELKSIKPDLLLLAEDKGSDIQVYEQGFDAAYDWTDNMTWVSQWAWEYEYSEEMSKTVFNHPDVSMRGELLREALFQNPHFQFRLLRFLENNDISRFISVHGLERTKMGAALLFSIPGIPMIYNGQEVGYREHPYETHAIFERETSIETANHELFAYYKKLIELHLKYPALNGDNSMKEVIVSAEPAIVSFSRTKGDQTFIIMTNLNSSGTSVTVIPDEILNNLPSSEAVKLEDILTGDTFYSDKDNGEVVIQMGGYSTRWLLINE